MLTSQLLESWGIDQAALVATARAAVGPCDVFLGGSLADDVGTVTSDIDLYCFVPGASGGTGTRVPAVTTRCGPASVDCHVVFAFDYRPFAESLRALLVHDTVPSRMPYPSAGDLRCMHALFRDRALAPGEAAEAVRSATAADITHLYVALRSVVSCAASAEDALAMLTVGEYWNALYSTRLVAEFALDAALAMAGEFNPNTKWRMSLAARAIMGGSLPYDMDTLAAGLFPSPSGEGSGFGTAAALAQGCLAIGGDSLLGTYRHLHEAQALVSELVERLGAAAPTFVRA